MKTRQFSVGELLWWVTVAAVLLGTLKAFLPPEETVVLVFLGTWVLGAILVRLFYGAWATVKALPSCGAVFFAVTSIRAVGVGGNSLTRAFTGLALGTALGLAIAGVVVVAGLPPLLLGWMQARFRARSQSDPK